ncbi:sodium-dependent transporter [Lacicoccus alkaliphilus]|uniref:Transporter n=1 Tax=Lacicoccus alkaliphilus DSM 16010 TaxID=1123231 RepID=A0A1M7E8Y0_9BACL|nr:sodium-dependent transporter [Salinicoccus alkaliphilus]SHL88058.1 neurotransmitter:Na+ symporter, NSS family [Salinicoccus alkaliphilus DSM 16010]
MEKSQWGSKIGFILAAAGSAIGLGALWRFPYMTAEHGGGAFLLIFLLFTLVVGLPLLLSEFVIGRAGGRNPIEGFEYLGGKRWYRVFGWSGNIAVILLLSFYSVIGGWILLYLVVAFINTVGLLPITDYGDMFGRVVTNPLYVILGQGTFLLLTVLIVSQGVQRGLERASKIMMPLLFILFVVIIIRSLTLPNAMEGVDFFLRPSFENINSEAVLYALGQSFFALSIGATTMITYASYLDKSHNLAQSALYIVLMNVVISVMAGLAIFPAIASFEMENVFGPGLIFIVLPQVFSEIALGNVFYILFLLAFLFATLTSAISMIEINVANAIKGNEDRRKMMAYVFGLIVFVIGIPSALSEGVLNDVQFFAGTIFDNVDFLVSNIMLPFNALVSSVFVGYILEYSTVKNQVGVVQDSRMYTFFRGWILLLKFVLPVIIILVFVSNLLGFF